eukprot:TRINITY_DN8796_c0_g1_i1.p1 TRINITY_DN8796_c0_g1~~TRINITY_DN8796_c0_g1_i1.p1  ORF type:complete len:265 (+),score=74.66 TRINITY_DN8796_c0_g1_i1:242-1036(+)
MRAFRPSAASGSSFISLPSYVQYNNNNNSIEEVHEARGIVRRIFQQQPDIRRRVLGPRLPSEAVDDVFELSEQLTNDPGVRRAFMDRWRRMREENNPLVQKCLDLYSEQGRRLANHELHADDDDLISLEDEPGAPSRSGDASSRSFASKEQVDSDDDDDDQCVFDAIVDWFVNWGDWVLSFFGAASSSEKYDSSKSRAAAFGYSRQYQGPGFEDVSPSPVRDPAAGHHHHHRHHGRDGFDAVFEAAGLTSVLILIVVALMKVLR